jgi:hypothetical protein
VRPLYQVSVDQKTHFSSGVGIYLSHGLLPSFPKSSHTTNRATEWPARIIPDSP